MKKDKRETCSSCGVKYIDHPGLIPTCKKLREFISELKSIQDTVNYSDDSYIDRLNNVHSRIDKLLKKYEK